jgi:hypothetical protein
MGNANGETDDAESMRLGRRTIDDGILSTNRDSLLGILCSWWPEVGSYLTTATTPEALRHALQPVKELPDRHLIASLLRPTTVIAPPEDIRKKRLALGEAVKFMNDARAKCDQCMSACREIECAMIQARPEQFDLIQREFPNRRTECQEAQNQMRIKNASEMALERELLDQEAGFAQDELLTFITKRKYALHPLNLANAMAGLPYTRSVPFLGAWQSHARCSKLSCPGWPSFHYQIFETIESLWMDSALSPIATAEFFQQGVRALPKTVQARRPGQSKPQKTDNFVRTYLSANWWYLERAIERSVQPHNDPRPMPYLISSHFNSLLGSPKNATDLFIAETAKLR